MRTIAILAPPIDGVTPEKYERAQNAMLQQMMLLAQGLPVTHPAVRAAAEVVGSALAADPLEFALAAKWNPSGARLKQESLSLAQDGPDPSPMSDGDSSTAIEPRPDSTVKPELDGSRPTRDRAYARYLATIYAAKPAAARK